MSDIIARIEALLANTPQSEIEEFEVTRCLRDCRDEIIAARACAEMMLQGTGQRLAEGMAKRVIEGQTIGAWIPVSERLPAWGQFVIVAYRVACGPPEREVGAECHYADGVWTGCDKMRGGQPTHWMPMPAPPAEVTL